MSVNLKVKCCLLHSTFVFFGFYQIIKRNGYVLFMCDFIYYRGKPISPCSDYFFKIVSGITRIGIICLTIVVQSFENRVKVFQTIIRKC